MKKPINLSDSIILNRQKLDRIARDLRRINKEFDEVCNILDMKQAIDAIEYASIILQDFENYRDLINEGVNNGIFYITMYRIIYHVPGCGSSGKLLLLTYNII